jgi:hypothetical protein
LGFSPCGTVFHDSTRKHPKKIVPQRLKPRGTSNSCGTAKAVPFL